MLRGLLFCVDEKKPVKFSFGWFFYEGCCESRHPGDLEGLAVVMIVLRFGEFVVLTSDEIDEQLRYRDQRDDESD